MEQKPAPERKAVLALLRRGEVTLSEAAELAGVSRQLVYAWCKRAGIDWQAARQARIARAWRKELRSGPDLAAWGRTREKD